ncbi:hypothetical protein F511_34328 [Dorcoceras hygrometricum]|uniref:LIM zinc-binding domain-containing protein n=1 Tax=Dorcoceras hygrometricum TaxID=472368 RepID=A0A2Z7B0F4_9LAMI|nr:hypothetical protein F511_34328 [Dorcoceras hygrometricum]
MAAFTGTLDKCKACEKTVYFIDLLTTDGATYHKSCFKCSHCKGTLVMSNYSSMDGVLYCKPHFEQLFKESGNFSKNFQTSKPERENSLMTMEGESFHKSCFKCAHGGCPLTHSSYAALDGILYCKVHFQQLFMEKGNYQHVLKGATYKKSGVEPVEAEVEATHDDEPKEEEGDVKPENESESDKAQEQS